MTKHELIERIARRGGLPAELTKRQITHVVDATFAELSDYFVRARLSSRATPRFSFPGFGTFTKKLRAGRKGCDPRSGAPIVIPQTTTLGFQPGRELKAMLNRVLPHRQVRG